MTAILYALLFSVLPPEDAWRALFILGIVPAIFVDIRPAPGQGSGSL